MKPSIDQVVATYQRSLYTVAFHLCKNVQDAEDVVQDTFLAYWLSKQDFASEQHVRAWLLRVAINKAKNKCNTFFRRATVPLEDYMQTLEFPSEEASALFAAVLALPEKYRVVVHLFYYEDYSVKEIAEILHLTPGTVKTRLSRGRAALRSTCKEAWNDDE